MAKNTQINLTEGPIGKRILAFALPIFIGNLFQQLYGAVDSFIVGNVLGTAALAAVSSCGSLMFLLVGFVGGIAIGAGVVIARYFGAGDMEKLETAVHTTVAFGFAGGIFLTVFGVGFTPLALRLMGTPKDVMPQAVEYLRCYFFGGIPLMLYNIFMGIMQSVGDSRHPLYYLIFSGCLNIVLDYLFVGVMGKGVGYAGIATVLSQMVSMLLCFRRLVSTKEPYRVEIPKIRFHRQMLKEVMKNGLPAGVQNSVISFANVIVQSNINSFGKLAVAGCGAFNKVEGFAFLPITCFSMALTTFISQNLGAKNYDRVKKGARFGVVCSITAAEIIGVITITGAPFFIGIFNDNPEMIAYGVAQARIMSLFYFLLAFSHCAAGILRGAGKAEAPMFVMLVCWCAIRVAYIEIGVRWVRSIKVVFWAYPITWTLSSLAFFYMLKKLGKKMDSH